MVGAVKRIQPIKHVLARVRVDNVEEDGDTHPVSSIDELLQLFWSAISGTGSKEACDLVSEG